MSISGIILACVGALALAIVSGIAIHKYLRSGKLERTNTVTDEFIDHPIPSGVYLIVGPQGVGKTSFMNALISIDSKYHGAWRYQQAMNEWAYLHDTCGYKTLQKPFPCAYRTRSKLFLPNGNPTLHTDISQFGLPGRRSDVMHVPPFTVFGIDEIDSFMDCRAWNKDQALKSDIIDGLKYIRHHDLVFIGDLQNFSKVDLSVRRLTTDVIYILKKKDVYKRKHRLSRKQVLVQTEWEFIWVKHQLAENAEALREMGIDVGDKNARRCKLIYEGNIYRQYNSQSGKPYWLRSLTQYEVQKHPENPFTAEGVERYCSQNALDANGRDVSPE